MARGPASSWRWHPVTAGHPRGGQHHQHYERGLDEADLRETVRRPSVRHSAAGCPSRIRQTPVPGRCRSKGPPRRPTRYRHRRPCVSPLDRAHRAARDPEPHSPESETERQQVWQPAASGSSLACPNPQGSLRAITARQLKRLLGSSFANEAPSPNAEPDAHSEDERVTGEEPLPVDYLKDVRDGDNGEQDASGNQVGSHGVPPWSRDCARRSHRQTGPSSGSTTSPTKWNPHLARTRVDALYAGSVCARTRRTRSLANANATSAVAASVAKPRPSNAGTMP